jgi:DNA invertase Pin-like site-specific DNA recombinase
MLYANDGKGQTTLATFDTTGKSWELKGGIIMHEIKYKAIKYIRLSDPDSKKDANGKKIVRQESDSVGNQRMLIDDYLRNHPEIEVVDEKVDDGFSGILFDRPAFKEMMQAIENGWVNCVITKDLSRLGREYVETGRYLRRIFPAYGVRFIAINDNIDTMKDSGDDLTVSLRSIINDAYCRDISIKTRSALDAKRAGGSFTGACPIYGYKKTDGVRKQLFIDEYPASIVEDIYRMKLNGYSAARIAAMLNERGVLSPMEYKKDRGLPHPKGGYADIDSAKWSATTIIRILTDETYTGTLIQGKSWTPNYKLRQLVQKPEDEWHKTNDAHDAIISKNTFDLTQKVMQLDTRTAPDSDRVYIFSGILICGCCGGQMSRKAVPYKNMKYLYYFCPTGKKKGCSEAVMLKEDALADCVLNSVKAHIINVAELETIISGLDAVQIAHGFADNLKAQIAENERKLEKIRSFKAGLYENMVSGNLNKDEYKSLKAQYSDDAAVLIEANDLLNNEVEDVLSFRHERMAWMEHFKEFENLRMLDRRTVIHLIQSIRVIRKNEIEISFNYQLEYDNALTLLQKEVA